MPVVKDELRKVHNELVALNSELSALLTSLESNPEYAALKNEFSAPVTNEKGAEIAADPSGFAARYERWVKVTAIAKQMLSRIHILEGMAKDPEYLRVVGHS